MIFIFLGIIGILGLFYRLLKFVRFIKNISTICHMYDWKCVDENPEEYLEEILKEDYYFENEWSAYNFLYLKGPNPREMFFSLKPFKLESFYDKDIIEKIKNKII